MLSIEEFGSLEPDASQKVKAGNILRLAIQMLKWVENLQEVSDSEFDIPPEKLGDELEDGGVYATTAASNLFALGVHLYSKSSDYTVWPIEDASAINAYRLSKECTGVDFETVTRMVDDFYFKRFPTELKDSLGTDGYVAGCPRDKIKLKYVLVTLLQRRPQDRTSAAKILQRLKEYDVELKNPADVPSRRWLHLATSQIRRQKELDEELDKELARIADLARARDYSMLDEGHSLHDAQEDEEGEEEDQWTMDATSFLQIRSDESPPPSPLPITMQTLSPSSSSSDRVPDEAFEMLQGQTDISKADVDQAVTLAADLKHVKDVFSRSADSIDMGSPWTKVGSSYNSSPLSASPPGGRACRLSRPGARISLPGQTSKQIDDMLLNMIDSSDESQATTPKEQRRAIDYERDGVDVFTPYLPAAFALNSLSPQRGSMDAAHQHEVIGKHLSENDLGVFAPEAAGSPDNQSEKASTDFVVSQFFNERTRILIEGHSAMAEVDRPNVIRAAKEAPAPTFNLDARWHYGFRAGGQSVMLKVDTADKSKSYVLKIMCKMNDLILSTGALNTLHPAFVRKVVEFYHAELTMASQFDDCPYVTSPLMWRRGEPALKDVPFPDDTPADNFEHFTQDNMKTFQAQVWKAAQEIHFWSGKTNREEYPFNIFGPDAENLWTYPMLVYEYADQGDILHDFYDPQLGGSDVLHMADSLFRKNWFSNFEFNFLNNK